MELSPSSFIEKYSFSDVDDVVSFAFGKNIVLHVVDTDGVSQRDSKRARSQVLTDYKWNNTGSCEGRTLAVRDNLIAYRLFNENTGEAVRVLERESRARRLIKDFNYPIVDIQWAIHAPLLAVLDLHGSIYIYHVDEESNTLNKYLNIIRQPSVAADVSPTLAWCPYVPEDDVNTSKDVHLLAVAFGSSVLIYFLNTIKQEFNARSEMELKQALAVSGGVFVVELNSVVTSVKLSPDATAMAVATMDGHVSFYVIDSERTRFVSRVQPIQNNYVEEIAFLDNLTIGSQQEQFWKYVVLSADSGRRLAIYDSGDWSCISKLRFESLNQLNRLEFSMDQMARFIFMADYDSSCLYCLELSHSGARPCFTSCTRIPFFNSLVSICPCSVSEITDSEKEMSLDDADEPSDAMNATVATFIALTTRSLIETSIELDRHELDPSVVLPGVSNEFAGSFTTEPSYVDSSTNIILSTFDKTAPTSLAATTSRSIKTDNSYFYGDEDTLANENSILDDLPPPSSNVPVNLDSLFGHNNKRIVTGERSKGYSAAQPTCSQNNSGVMAPAGPSLDQMVSAFSALLDARLTPLIEKVDELQADVQKLQLDTDNALQKISNQISEQTERIEAQLIDSATDSRERIIAAVDSSLSAGAIRLQTIADLSRTQILDVVSKTVNEMTAPVVEALCAQLFGEMNSKFRSGLQEFMDQLAQFQRESSLFFMKRSGKY